jgi:hypothetical protein
MLMPDRASIFEAIELESPGADPLSTIESWLAGLSERVLGFNPSDANRLLFRSLVEGLGPEQILQRLHAQYSAESVDAQAERLLDHARRLARSDLFFPLFSESPFQQVVAER